MAFTPPPGATLNEYGYWILPDGGFAPGQDMSGQMAGATPAQRASTGGPVQTEPSTGKHYRTVDGQKWYLPPASGNTGDPGGDVIHGRAQWNPKTGAYDTPLDWGKILTMVTAGIITAGAADAILASTPALAATAPTGASAASSAPVLEGVAAGGGGAATTVPIGTAAAELGPSTAANIAATQAAISVPSSLAPVVTAATSGVSYGDLLKYVVPTAGNLIGGIIQSKATGAASDAQQKYLEEALAYQKEQDTYNRNRQAGLDAQEVQRYGAYQGRIGGFIANGQNSNDRMSALLGLPARAPGSSSGASSGPPASQRVATDPATQAAIRTELQRVNSNDSPAAWDEYLASHGDSSAKNWSYWKDRIDIGDGVGKGYAGTSSAPPVSPQPSAPSAPAVTTQPQARSAAAVQMRGPDGSVKAVSADQVDHYKALGATVLGAAA
jgi:hypothetical protein